MIRLENGKLSGDTVLFISALEQELTDFIAALDFQRRNLGPLEYDLFSDPCGRRVIGHVCGIGKVNAAASTAAFLSHPEYNVSYVVSVGTAGGLDKSLKTGDIVVGRDFVQHDFDVSSVLPDCKPGQIPGCELFMKTLPPEMEAVLPADENLRIGTIISGDHFVKEGEKLAGFKPLAVEMEGAAMAQVCLRYNTPFLSIRVITDSADEEAVNDWPRLFAKLSRISSGYAHKALKAFGPLFD
jgi:adenosylhomocysteine nucleosidase